MMELTAYQDKLDAICEAVGVKRLDLFGSAARNDFGEASDVDVVVEFFEEDTFGSLFDRYFKLKEDLELLFERDVDVVMEEAIKNPIFREGVNRARVLIYAA